MQETSAVLDSINDQVGKLPHILDILYFTDAKTNDVVAGAGTGTRANAPPIIRPQSSTWATNSTNSKSWASLTSYVARTWDK
jgi:hypothetical protein